LAGAWLKGLESEISAAPMGSDPWTIILFFTSSYTLQIRPVLAIYAIPCQLLTDYKMIECHRITVLSGHRSYTLYYTSIVMAAWKTQIHRE